MPKEQNNIVKKVLQEFNYSQKQLADILDVSESTITKWIKGDIPKMAKLALELMIENKVKNEKLQTIKKAFKIINEVD